MARPRALHIAPLAPARTGNGLAMRQGIFLEALARVADTTLLLPLVPGAPSDLAAELGVRLEKVATAGRADTRYTLLSRLAAPAARLDAFRAYGRGSRHAALSVPVLAELRARFGAGGFDLVHAGRLYLAEAALAVAAPRTLDLDEDDAWVWQQQAARHRAAGNADAAAWAEAEAAAETRLLARAAPGFAASFIAAPADRDRVAARHPGLSPEHIANGVPFPAAPRRRDDGRTLLFVGALGYGPNVAGLLWFAAHVLPLLATTPASPRLVIVGRDAPPAIRALAAHPHIELAGALADVTPAYETATLALAPLLAGGGTRIKVIEAAAHLVPIVATTIGAEGLALDDTMLWRADTPAGFAAAIREALADPEARARRAHRARAHLRPFSDRAQLVDALACRFEAIVAKAGAFPS